MSDEDDDYAAAATELCRNPRLARGFMRGQLLGVMSDFLVALWRVAYDTIADGAPLPPVNALKALAWQLQVSTSDAGTASVITMDKVMGRTGLAALALPAWLQARQLAPREIHVVARTRGMAAELRRRFRRLQKLQHLAWMQEVLCPDFTEEGRERRRRSLVLGEVTWGAPLAQTATRFLDDLIVCDPLPQGGASQGDLENLVDWLEGTRRLSRRPDGMPTLTLLTDRASGGELASTLASRGWRHVDIPAVAPADFSLPVAPLVEMSWKAGSNVGLQPYTPYELAEIRRQTSSAAFAVSFS
jgi:hypothetical protein